jgi:hypothetical protein
MNERLEALLALHQRLVCDHRDPFEQPTPAEVEAARVLAEDGLSRKNRPRRPRKSADGIAWLDASVKYEAERKSLERAGVDVEDEIRKRFSRAADAVLPNMEALVRARFAEEWPETLGRRGGGA